MLVSECTKQGGELLVTMRSHCSVHSPFVKTTGRDLPSGGVPFPSRRGAASHESRDDPSPSLGSAFVSAGVSTTPTGGGATWTRVEPPWRESLTRGSRVAVATDPCAWC